MNFGASIKIFIPGKLPTLNEYILAERGNRFMAAKMKKQATDKCTRYFKQVSPVDTIGPVTFVWKHENRRKDPDNVEYGQKFIFDGMVKAGFLKGDGWKHRAPESHHFHILDKDAPGVDVIFREVINTT